MLTPAFEPAIATPEMLASDLHSRFAETDSGRVHFVVAGSPHPDAARVLFVHGSPGAWDAWERFLKDPELRAAARLIALDRPGFGGSERGRAEPAPSGRSAGRSLPGRRALHSLAEARNCQPSSARTTGPPRHRRVI